MMIIGEPLSEDQNQTNQMELEIEEDELLLIINQIILI